MLILFILIILTGVGIYLLKSYEDRFEILGLLLVFIFGIYLIIHILLMSLASYEYNKMVVKRTAFTETLEYARKNGKEIELAAITKDVSEFNQELAVSKYENTVFLLSAYVDDRIIELKPIY